MIPSKPFDSFKWRWLSVQPTEGLLKPPVFLGVLRTFKKFELKQPSDPKLLEALGIVQKETGTRVNLVRTQERNLIRNSGQYWKGTGLLKATPGLIELTKLGQKVASGEVTQGEFATLIVAQTVLPNSFTYSPEEITKWEKAKLEIRPFVLILDVISQLGKRFGMEEAFITPTELIKLVIPLSGVRQEPAAIARYLHQHRFGKLNMKGWPDCAPAANDKRMAREFLLFLSNYSLCHVLEKDRSNYDQKFFSSEIFDEDVSSLITGISIFDEDPDTDRILSSARESGFPSKIERQRTIVSIISRPNQSQFRKNILAAYKSKCLLTGESIREVLEAAHIIPVLNGGSDLISNGICLRVDIHRLFDSGNIKIQSGGLLQLSDAVNISKTYKELPKKVPIPSFVEEPNLDWRIKYS